MDPIRFDIGGGGGSQVSFSMAPATTSVMPGLDVSDSGAAATSAPVRFEGFGMGDVVSTAPPEPAKPEAAPKARGLTGKVQLLIAGVAADAGLELASKAAAGAAILDSTSFADPTVEALADGAAVTAWWADATKDIGDAGAPTAGSQCVAVAREAEGTDGAAVAFGDADAVVAFIRGRIGGGGALHQPQVTHTASASADAAGAHFDYDLLVIGGGSGGLACAKEASKLGANVCLCDFVKPSPAGTRWGLGGTCVNVGCIPKKLMHRSALLAEEAKDLPFFGWGSEASAAAAAAAEGEPKAPTLGIRWSKLVGNVQDHIAGLNFGYKGELRDYSITYRNALASLTGTPHEVSLRDKQGKTSTVTAKRIVVAVGGRPRALSCPGAELAISSDDVFQLSNAPGETLIIGGGYIALETAGFLAGLGFKVTLMVRSILLRGFDRECVVLIEKDLVRRGVTILPHCTPVKIEGAASSSSSAAEAATATSGRKSVTWKDEDGKEASADFDTVFCAIGRDADTSSLGLADAGVTTNRSGKIVCTEEQSSVPHIFAIGDVVAGKPELTPVAIQAGRSLARRLFAGSTAGFDYRCVATTVFTPLEYGTIGLSEEAAEEQLGAENVDAFLSKYKPLEWSLNYYRHEESAFAKVIVDLRDDRVVGLHYLGPNAGEVTQGFAAAMRMGLTFTALRDTVGIHPTVAEELTSLEVSRSSGAPIEKGSC
ncbi:hypothetical protein FNF28_04254 [Cafeteria roenbergensis]|uniref:thioredoxin-disulfide reductase (NADPH) n=1 Tax=Cafeteria roenbergensis TaxID=33653 RepID=A0A5A8DFE6_CAFRO|nr:hypothetical protein FNF28_04254 [Cafeteria roenbergensis]